MLIDRVSAYDTHPVLYSALPNPSKGTYNSNSFTFSLLYDSGLGGMFTPTGWAPGWGWNFIVPGL
jgi:hypothetical protein